MCKLPLKIQKLILPRLVPNDPQSAVPRKKLLKDDVDEENDDVGQHEGDQVVSVQARINVLKTIFLKQISLFYYFFLNDIFNFFFIKFALNTIV
jgi:hypothetical protein